MPYNLEDDSSGLSSGGDVSATHSGAVPLPPPPPPLPADSQPLLVPKPPLLPPNFSFSNTSSKFKALVQGGMNGSGAPISPCVEEPFQPCHLFFYGSLMDAEVLQSILDLSGTPALRNAVVPGFATKMWGIYPVLVLQEQGIVSGKVWKVTSEEHFLKLVEYETSVYTWRRCEAMLDEGEVLQDCRTFCWAGDPQSRELEEGSFDLERYRRYFKSSVTNAQRHG